MSSDYIRREDAVDAVEFGITLASKINLDTGEWTELFQRENDELREAVERIKDIEPADVAPVRHARWEHVKHKSVEHGEIVIDGETVRCSDCRHAEKGWNAGMNFCPNCGAKMDGEE